MGSFLRLLLFSDKFDWLGRAASFLASPLPPFGRAWRQEISIRIFRIFLILSALLYPTFGLVYQAEYPGMVDPMVIRLGLSAAAILCLVASYRSDWVQRKAVPIIVGFAYVDMLWFAGLAYLNDLSYPYALGLFFVYVAAAVLSSGSFETIRPLVGMLVSGFVIVIVTALAVHEPQASAILLILSTGSIGAAIYVLVAAYIQSMAILDRQQGAMVEAQEIAQMGSWEFDPRSGHQHWSEGMFHLLGMDPDRDMPGLEVFLRRVVPADRALLIQALRETAPQQSFRVQLVTKDAVTRTMRVICKVDSGPNEVPLRYYGSIKDVTDEVRHEETLIIARDEAERARQRAEELSEAKSTLLANMSHEIRTPLTAIIGFSEILVTEVEGTPREYADLVLDSGRRLLHTLNSVLDLARLRSGNLELALRPLDVSTTLDAVTRMFRNQVNEKGLVMSVSGDPHVTPVLADALALERILTNLVSNAVKFTDHGEITLSVTNGGSQVVIDVSDTGCGMAPDFLPRLFEEFRQESEGITREHEGSGLGLAITRQLVELMNGQITVDTALGRGTTFSVSLPAAPTNGESGPADVDADLIDAPPELPWS